MAIEPRHRGKRTTVLTEDEMAAIPATMPVRSKPRTKLVSPNGKPLRSGEYLAGIARMVKANLPLEEVLHDFAEHVEAQVVPEALERSPGRTIARPQAVGDPENDQATTTSRVSMNHQFPWWDPRGHMIDLMAAPKDDGMPCGYHIARQVVTRAEEGNMEAIKELLDRTVGKSTQHVEMRTEQHINHYDVSCDPACFDVIVREDEPETRKVIEDAPELDSPADQ